MKKAPGTIHKYQLRVGSLNPLTPKSDWHPISPRNSVPESSSKATRIKEIITN